MRVECGASSNRVRRLSIMTVAAFVVGAWFCYDGWVGYPAVNMADYKRVAGTENEGKVILDDRVTADLGGLQRDEALTKLGDAPYVEKSDHRLYFSAAGFVRVPHASGTTVSFQSAHHNAAGIQLQKILGVGLFPIGLLFIVITLKARGKSIVLDESGLIINGGTHIKFDQMKRLIVDRWRDKGWVDLEFEANGATRTCRLDSYHVDNFDPMLDALCQRKGFTNPRQSVRNP